MKHILLLGAGRSSVYLIDYLVAQAPSQNWHVTIADLQTAHLPARGLPSTFLSYLNLDIQEQAQLNSQVQKADVVISLLPAIFHLPVAKACLAIKRHFLTASYVTPEIQAMHEAAKEHGLLFLMEMGLDPGIDHLSAKATIDRIREQGGQLFSFKSYTGGLVAPESDTNPWHYKISWNPRNVVLAGKGTATYLYNHTPKYIPYSQLFRRTEQINVIDLGELEGYANRDSLAYQKAYGLENIPTLIRGTLRWPGFCAAWHQLIKLGLTDDSYRLPDSENITYTQWLESYLPDNQLKKQDTIDRLAHYLKLPGNSRELEAIRYLGLLESEKIKLKKATPAQILEQRLVQRLALQPTDQDLVVMQHEFEYGFNNQKKRLKSALVLTGQDATYTAMAQTVGMPLAFAAELLLTNEINLSGVHIPVLPELYRPLLARLEKIGIQFTEQEENF
ncbi:saccharopine dehydrogenase C-terminal domain-containing protein [Adhaeribacter pallidiroseus]|uniref:Saccharopine dehydrogenase (NADP(+), L-lysine-forming) n=1 Tax=Adhaeribacter pallidiroseus TaxID=2072847 RepID=A0A369QGW1_9BACT|nr:saccharopine dehydrogenase C-terminal domain-containing protein [Adhaeribacter pallidiroseus]RDC63510.1 Saccharopine dehydrogenase (NADP(+), L-lysine-forming) [Adhaeribacter pallidiroseus]